MTLRLGWLFLIRFNTDRLLRDRICMREIIWTYLHMIDQFCQIYDSHQYIFSMKVEQLQHIGLN